MLQRLKKIAYQNLVNIPGWRTDRKIVVFESDDWGSIRMSSKENLQKLTMMGIEMEKCHYMQNDALASEEDLNLLFNLLYSYKDSNGSNPTITANVIMANPDFEKIRASNFSKYCYEPFTDTLKRYPNHQNSFEIWQEGIKEGVFYPQFHGKEHIQVIRWMNFLQNPKSYTREAFYLDVFGISTTVVAEKRGSFLAAYDWDDEKSRSYVLNAITEGLALFESLFGFQSLTTVAPNYTWHPDVEKVFNNNNIKYIQGSSVQKSPDYRHKKVKKIRHFTGQRNSMGQRYLVRNCKFEPSSSPNNDWVDRCMEDIRNAFIWKKPAIIATHRVNYISSINTLNRDRNLKKLETLIGEIIKTWPEVEFMTSDQLGKVIDENE